LFGQSIGINTCVLIGGVDYIKQLNELERIPHVVIGTPGRTKDMLEKSLTFQQYVKNARYYVK
jgi:superfamily II DNA/RNA helicase